MPRMEPIDINRISFVLNTLNRHMGKIFRKLLMELANCPSYVPNITDDVV